MDAQDSNSLGVIVSSLVGGIVAWPLGLGVAHGAALYATSAFQCSYLTAFIVAACIAILVLEIVCTILVARCWRWQTLE